MVAAFSARTLARQTAEARLQAYEAQEFHLASGVTLSSPRVVIVQ
jgi:hypothetical protein